MKRVLSQSPKVALILLGVIFLFAIGMIGRAMTQVDESQIKPLSIVLGLIVLNFAWWIFKTLRAKSVWFDRVEVTAKNEFTGEIQTVDLRNVIDLKLPTISPYASIVYSDENGIKKRIKFIVAWHLKMNLLIRSATMFGDSGPRSELDEFYQAINGPFFSD